MICKKHGIKHNWTCWVCEQTCNYIGRSHLVEDFDRGFRNESYIGASADTKAAWEDGKKCGVSARKQTNKC